MSVSVLASQPDIMEGNVFDGRLDHIRLDPEVGAVVVGFDSHISFNKILKASSYLKNPDVLFIATNRDERFPMEHVVCPGKKERQGGLEYLSVCVLRDEAPGHLTPSYHTQLTVVDVAKHVGTYVVRTVATCAHRHAIAIDRAVNMAAAAAPST